MSDPTYTMFGAPLSLYSGKLRCYLRKKGVAFRELLPSHKDHLEKVLPVVGRPVLPTMIDQHGTVHQDTTLIIDVVEQQSNKPGMLGASTFNQALVRLFELIGDEALLRPAMHYRWTYREENNPFLTYEFARTMDHRAPFEAASQVAEAIMDKMSGYLPILGVTDATMGTIEENYLAFLKAMNAHLMAFPYMLGGVPTVADCGLMGPLYAHLARDPYPATVMKNNAHHVYRWVERMNAADADVPELAGSDMSEEEIEALAPTLLPVLKAAAVDFGPEVSALMTFMVNYIQENPCEPGSPVLPKGMRGLGMISIPLGGNDTPIAVRPFTVFKIQRLQDSFDQLNDGEKAQFKDILEQAGLGDLVGIRLPRRIKRENYKEVWA